MKYINQNYDEERALYDIEDAEIINCTFAGEADGESALKECRRIKVESCLFELRYPFWHVSGAEISNITMTETCRAALWYDDHVNIEKSTLHGIKALRECKNVTLSECDVDSAEFGWRCSDITVKNTTVNSQYPFFECKNIQLSEFTLSGKYSFQYVENVEIKNSNLKTKDAFWHAKDVTVYDSVIEGEYLGWYSENLRLVRCHIKGTQPLCYCKNLILEDCTTEDCDLSFENSEVRATVNGDIVSVKNPVSGFVKADSIGEIIWDEKHKKASTCKIECAVKI
ncbi:MAG: DUF3737 family protein [Clostridia bacterium]|nr:DUF3737 family protein [Clostridia bacterium]